VLVVICELSSPVKQKVDAPEAMPGRSLVELSVR
jgi:hypothetical protein